MNIYRKGVYSVAEIEKALSELAKALEESATVERVKITFTLVKPKPDKANPKKVNK